MKFGFKFSRKATLPSLDLVGDGDDTYLFEEIENSLQIKLDAADVSEWRTVGDIYRCLLTKIGSSEEHQVKCAGQMSFYIVRKALKELVPTAKITPNTKFADLGLGSHKLLKTLLSEKYQLRAPNTDLSGIGCLGITLVWVVVGFWLNNNGFTLWYLTVAVGLGLFILHFLPGKFGGTVGAFSQSLADQNYAHFVRNGARADRQGLWEALSGIIESEVGLNLGFDSNTLLGPEEWYDIEWLRNFRRAR